MILPPPAPPRASCPSAARPLGGLTPPQEAALARLRCGLDEGDGVVLLVGAAGVGKSLVLARLASDPSSATRVAGATLLDDAHVADESRLLQVAASPRPTILAGRGRLLTLVARDGRLAARVRMRAVIPPFSIDDTRALVARRLSDRGGAGLDEGAVRTLHEIAAGIPAVVRRLVDLVALVSTEGRRLSADDVEAIHRRLDGLAE